VPDNPTGQARVRVMCASSIFFDISNADFTITSAGPTPTATATATATGTPPATATNTPAGPTLTPTPTLTATPTVTPGLPAFWVYLPVVRAGER
jgi:hypothetical protein